MNELLGEIAEFVRECLGPLSGSGDFTSWLRDFAIQLCGTILLFVIVRIFLWKPVTKFLEARKAAMDKELDDAKEHHNNALLLEEEMKEKYKEAKLEIQRLIKEAVAQGEMRKEAIINSAKVEAARRIEVAQEEINREVTRKSEEIKNQIVTIAFLAAEEIIGKEVDQTSYLDVVTKIIESGMKDE